MALVTGIIAEYNPFHNGHAYQIQKARELTGCDFVVVVMSGDFVQRGAPALFDKYTRTKMALLGAQTWYWNYRSGLPAPALNFLRQERFLF